MKLQDIEIIKKIKKEVVLATIINTKGSSPRDDARMVVSDQTTIGTIGGGELESGTRSDRPSSPGPSNLRYNTQDGQHEYYFNNPSAAEWN